jgi:MFS family permease
VPVAQGDGVQPSRSRGRSGLAALGVPNYRWILVNQFAQSASITAESLATGWLVLLLTDSPFWLGVVVGARGMAQLLFSAIGGAIADRSDLRVVLMRNQVIAAILWTVALVLVQTDRIALWHLIVASTAAGLLHAVNAPATNALTYAAVGPDRLLNANAFGFLARGLFRVAAALAGGYAIAAFGVPATYGLVVTTLLLGALALVPVSGITATVRAIESPIASLLNGLRYAVNTPRVRAILVFSLFTEVFGFSYLHMLPVVARDVLGVGAVGLGYLTAAAGAGQLVAMVGIAALGDIRDKHRLLLGSTCALGLAIVVFASTRSLPLALPALFVVGAAAGTYDSAMTTVVQMIVAPEMRGRVLGLLAATWGSNQVGGIGVGSLAALWGLPVALALCGALVAANAVRLIPRVALFDPRRV